MPKDLFRYRNVVKHTDYDESGAEIIHYSLWYTIECYAGFGIAFIKF